MRRFRGVIASASLKRLHRHRTQVPGPLRIPRRDCLGLIEARCLYEWLSSTLLIPRRDCLGLIEAKETDMHDGDTNHDSEA